MRIEDAPARFWHSRMHYCCTFSVHVARKRPKPTAEHRVHHGRRSGARALWLLWADENSHAEHRPYRRGRNEVQPVLLRGECLRAVAERADDGLAHGTYAGTQ